MDRTESAASFSRPSTKADESTSAGSYPRSLRSACIRRATSRTSPRAAASGLREDGTTATMLPRTARALPSLASSENS